MNPDTFYGPMTAPRFAGRTCDLCGESIKRGDFVWEAGQASNRRPPYKHAVVCSRHGNPRGAKSQSSPGRVTLTIRGTT